MSPTSLRAPTTAERRYIARNQLKCYLNFSVTATYNHHVSRAQLSQALRALLLDVDNLRLNIFRNNQSDTYEDDRRENGHNWHVRLVKRVRFDDVVSFEKRESALKDESVALTEYFTDLSKELNPINVETPPWRVKMLEINDRAYLTAYFDHTFYDGFVGLEFHKALVQKLSEMDENETPAFVDVLYDLEHDGPTSISRTVNQQERLYMAPFHYELWMRLTQLKPYTFVQQLLGSFMYRLTSLDLVRKLFGLRFRPSPSALSAPQFHYKPAGWQYATSYSLLHLEPAEVQTVLQFCRKQGFTLNPLLDILTIQTVDEVIRPEVSKTPMSYLLLTATNGRRYFPGLKFFTAASTFATKLGPMSGLTRSQLVDVVRTHSDRTAGKVATRDSFKAQGVNSERMNFWDSFDALVGGLSCVTAVGTNLGKQTFSSGEWRIEDMWFTQGNGVLYLIVVSVVTSHSGANLVMGFIPELAECMDGKLPEKFAKRYKERLFELVNGWG